MRIINNVFVTLMAQMNEILQHEGGNNFPSQRSNNMRKRWTQAFVQPQQISLPSFQQKQANLPLYLTRTTYTVMTKLLANNKEDNRDTTNDNNNETNEDDFYGIVI